MKVRSKVFLPTRNIFNDNRDVSGPGLKGCIEKIDLGTTERDILNDNLDTKGVTPGCPEVRLYT